MGTRHHCLRRGDNHSAQPLPKAAGWHPYSRGAHCHCSFLAGACLKQIRSILMRDTIAGTRRDRERPLPVPDTAEHVREVFELLRHHMNDVALVLRADP